MSKDGAPKCPSVTFDKLKSLILYKTCKLMKPLFLYLRRHNTSNLYIQLLIFNSNVLFLAHLLFKTNPSINSNALGPKYIM